MLKIIEKKDRTLEILQDLKIEKFKKGTTIFKYGNIIKMQRGNYHKIIHSFRRKYWSFYTKR